MSTHSTKEEEIVAYDAYTNLKHSSYKNARIACRFLRVTMRNIGESIRDNTITFEGLYFKIEPRKSFKPTKRYV
jgi:hypothetical protein